MSEAEKTITIVLGQKGENITTKNIMIMDKENTITHTPTNGGVIVVEKNGVYEKTGNIPTEFNVSKMLTADLIHTATAKMETVDNEVNGPTATQNMEGAITPLIQPPSNPALRDAQYAASRRLASQYPAKMVSEPVQQSEPIQQPNPEGENLAGGYRVTKRRRNPRRKQKKSYRRRRRV